MRPLAVVAAASIMARRPRRAQRCATCYLDRLLCVCQELSPLSLTTRVSLLTHFRETSRPGATGALALGALTNSEMRQYGTRGSKLDLGAMADPERRCIVLFPSEDARPLSRGWVTADRRPLTLIVPDGSWRQATRIARRLATVPGLERAELPYDLQVNPTGQSTFEAIARALGVIHGPEVQAPLDELQEAMQRAVLAVFGPTDRQRIEHPPLEILYRDEALVAIHKPAGVPTHRGWAREAAPADERLRQQLGRPVYPVHRLDSATSGVLLFGLSSEVARDVQQAFAAQAVSKVYLALCRGRDPELLRVERPLAKDKGSTPRPAITDFRLLGHFERYGLYEARPRTGRTHQIRRHLKWASHPVIGDVRYGKGEHNRIFRQRFGFHRLALHALSLELAHPRSSKRIELRAPPAPEFAALLDRLDLWPQR